MPELSVGGINVTHTRLVDLMALADQAYPFYQWVEERTRASMGRDGDLTTLLMSASREQIRSAIATCYNAGGQHPPVLVDGIGRTYPHGKACFYFFGWLIRDAPQQRLAPLVQRISARNDQPRWHSEVELLAALIFEYRQHVTTFSWESFREVVVDRLEGSRRSIRGHEREAVVRTAIVAALQDFYTTHGDYGRFTSVETAAGQVSVGNQTFDVAVDLLDSRGRRVHRLLAPIKTRETEGGGHAHLFTRDVSAALTAARTHDRTSYVIAVIVARNWSAREAENVRNEVDHAIILDMSPNDFGRLDDDEQIRLNSFVAEVLTGQREPRAASSSDG